MGEGGQLINTEALFVVCHCVSGGWWVGGCFLTQHSLLGSPEMKTILEGSSLWLS